MKIALVIIFVILGVALSAIILMQEGKNQGLGAISGMADTYWSKNKGRSIEGNLEKFTKFAAVAFFAIALILDIIW
ncbi:preprotein translocase subunit SecG [Oribacterium sp. oral taxon 102]|uniref:preprotein translocase subunit SecG n=1 Tax=Oribacterium sp. oral taxon 102 TaxID=671214 RepID=UPI0015BF4C95|nr:preprotein translocase subunit SecG [Oribacterium sp. oral taxon 102]NWO21145.1 preprotein translocase subunit SecG [Oribacterium sp. oral taxon 102]